MTAVAKAAAAKAKAYIAATPTDMKKIETVEATALKNFKRFYVECNAFKDAFALLRMDLRNSEVTPLLRAIHTRTPSPITV